MRTFRRGFVAQTSSEVMMVISVVTIAVTAASYAFVPRFQAGVEVLGANVQTMLSTGSFAGLGLSGVGNGDVPVGQTGARGGEGERENNGGGGWLGGLFGTMQDFLDRFRLATQNGGAPPTGIPGFVCGEWGLSEIARQLGVADADMQRFMDAAVALGFAKDGDYRLTARQLAVLARLAGMSAKVNHHRDFARARDWLTGEMEKGRYPMILVKGADGTPHWIMPTGVIKDENGRITGYKFRDANSPEEQTMSAADFDRAWGEQGYEGASIGNGSGVNLLSLAQ